ncbi:protein kinase [Nocardiopsis sp. CNT-189]|uniref:protein kinase n=1 Tax=Nocardiopsis oceanisediminis TaxID=2816862 RepID=UPI003B33BF42
MQIPFPRLIAPFTGAIQCTRPAGGGAGGAVTALVEAEKGAFFVKGVPNRPGGLLDSVAREGLINPSLGGLAPALLWRAENEHWVVLGFEAVQGRRADFCPGSPDLAGVAEAVERIGAVEPPAVARGWGETRWDRFTDEAALLGGDRLVYTDVQPDNLLITTGGRVRVVDWEWPTVGAGFITPACLAVQLIAAGHTPASAEDAVAGCRTWRKAQAEAVDAFAAANDRLHRWMAEARPEERWLKAMAEAAHRWAHYRGLKP